MGQKSGGGNTLGVGFFGGICGVGAYLMLVSLPSGASRTDMTEGKLPPSAYYIHCATATVEARRRLPAAPGLQATTADPQIIETRPQVRVACRTVDDLGVRRVMTVQILCIDALDPACGALIEIRDESGRTL